MALVPRAALCDIMFISFHNIWWLLWKQYLFAQHLNDVSGTLRSPKYTIFAPQVCSLRHLILRPHLISLFPKGDQMPPFAVKSVHKINSLVNAFNLQFSPFIGSTSPSVGNVREPCGKGEWVQKNRLLLFQLGSSRWEFQIKKIKRSSN